MTYLWKRDITPLQNNTSKTKEVIAHSESSANCLETSPSVERSSPMRQGDTGLGRRPVTPFSPDDLTELSLKPTSEVD